MRLQLAESQKREQKQREMYDSVVNAFQTQSDYIKEDREENQKRAEEIVLKSLNENHPKIKDFI